MDAIVNEVLFKIIGYLPRKDLLKVLLVNRTWLAIAEEFISKREYYYTFRIDKQIDALSSILDSRVFSGLQTPFPFRCYKFQLDFVREEGYLETFCKFHGSVIQQCVIHERSPDYKSTWVKIYAILKYLTNVRYLTIQTMFFRGCNWSNYVRILIQFPLLEFLHVDSSSDPTDVRELILGSPKLKTLSVKGRHTLNFMRKIFEADIGASYANLEVILKNFEVTPYSSEDLLYLIELNVSIIKISASIGTSDWNWRGGAVQNIDDGVQLHCFYKLLVNNSHTLTHLKITTRGKLVLPLKIPRLDNLMSLKLINRDDKLPSHFVTFAPEQFQCLRHLKLDLPDSWNFLDGLTEGPMNLESLYLVIKNVDASESQNVSQALNRFLKSQFKNIGKLELQLCDNVEVVNSVIPYKRL